MPTVREAISNFLTSQKSTRVGVEDLLGRWTPSMETQVNVAADDGEPVSGRRSTYSDGSTEWWNIRVPKDAKSEPHFKDYELQWRLSEHAEGIGCTGWDWENRRSRWVGFDFDSITGHAKGVGIVDEKLLAIQERATGLPYIEVRNSTGGKGLHLYVLFDEEGIPTANHTEHAALARSILSKMTTDTGFDFAQHVDCCGGNMWIWHRKQDKKPTGLTLVSAAEKILSESDLPPNWRDHIDVVTNKRTRVRVGGLESANKSQFDLLTSGRNNVPLDDQHQSLIQALPKTGCSGFWVNDYHLLQTHTTALEQIFKDPGEFGCNRILGVFKTNSEGTDPGEPNCFLFPEEGGAWKVFRFSPGTREEEYWDQDGQGWTTCHYNKRPTLRAAALAYGGIEDPEKSDYVFTDKESASAAMTALGEPDGLPDIPEGREVRLDLAKSSSRLSIKLEYQKDDPKIAGWIAKKGHLMKTSHVELQEDFPTLHDFDQSIRSLTSVDGGYAGWVVKDRSGVWIPRPKDDVKSVLASQRFPKNQVDGILGDAICDSWKLVNVPFQPEYFGDRQWNKGAIQLGYDVAELDYDDTPHHPHWDLVLSHIGQDLDASLKTLDWAKEAHIFNGGDYLRTWIACLLRDVFSHLPYLFFWGPENSGKSIFFESIGWLMENEGDGVIDGWYPISSKSDFNATMSNAILCFIDEKDLRTIPGSIQRIKQWINSDFVTIRRMRTDAYQVRNTTHWVQLANDKSFLPAFHGDSRITMGYVPLPQTDIPKPELKKYMIKEIPHFLYTIMHMQLPAKTTRLALPVVETEGKSIAEEENMTGLQSFCHQYLEEYSGSRVLFLEFYDRFFDQLPDTEKHIWTNRKASAELPVKYHTIRGTGNKLFINNVKWSV